MDGKNIVFDYGTEGDEKGLVFANYTDDETCLGVGKTEKSAIRDLKKQYKSLGDLIESNRKP